MGGGQWPAQNQVHTAVHSTTEGHARSFPLGLSYGPSRPQQKKSGTPTQVAKTPTIHLVVFFFFFATINIDFFLSRSIRCACVLPAKMIPALLRAGRRRDAAQSVESARYFRFKKGSGSWPCLGYIWTGIQGSRCLS